MERCCLALRTRIQKTRRCGSKAVGESIQIKGREDVKPHGREQSPSARTHREQIARTRRKEREHLLQARWCEPRIGAAILSKLLTEGMQEAAVKVGSRRGQAGETLKLLLLRRISGAAEDVLRQGAHRVQ